jgi:hypothetical protein
MVQLIRACSSLSMRMLKHRHPEREAALAAAR